MLRIHKTIFITGKAIVLDCVFLLEKRITDLEAKGVYLGYIIKNQSYWPKGGPGDFPDTQFQDRKVCYVSMIEFKNPR